MKKRVVKVLLPLLFSFCCVFSGFLNVRVDAITQFDGEAIYTGEETTLFINGNPISEGIWNEFNYIFTNSTSTNANSLLFNLKNGFVLNFDFDLYDYYLSVAVTNEVQNYNESNGFTFFPSSVYIRQFLDGQRSDIRLSNLQIYDCDANPDNFPNAKGFYAYGQIDDLNDNYMLSSIYIEGSGVIPQSDYILVQPYIYRFPKNSSDDYVNSIIAAINNQTGALQGSIGQAADDVQQSIEDQYSGDPEEEFSVDDVITQHNEKMGVLSFGSDVMLQFLDMFQSANVGTAQLTLPGFNITVEDTEYQVWPDYQFNFNQLDEWLPSLMSVIRLMLPAFVWLMVLRYCINVFEKNFLSNGG